MFTAKWWSIEHTHTPVPKAAHTPIPKHTASYKSTKNLSVAKCEFYDPSFPSNALSHYSIKLPAFVTSITSYGYVLKVFRRLVKIFIIWMWECLSTILDLFLISNPVFKSGSGSEFQMSYKLLFIRLTLVSLLYLHSYIYNLQEKKCQKLNKAICIKQGKWPLVHERQIPRVKRRNGVAI